MKRRFRKILAPLAAGILLLSIPISALTFSESNLHKDDRIDVRDLIRAKKDPDQYDDQFLSDLIDVLLEKAQLQEEQPQGNTGNTGGHGEIYLPEVP